MVHNSRHDMNSRQLVDYSEHGLKNGPFDELTHSHDLNAKLVCYSDPHYLQLINFEILMDLLDNV